MPLLMKSNKKGQTTNILNLQFFPPFSKTKINNNKKNVKQKKSLFLQVNEQNYKTKNENILICSDNRADIDKYNIFDVICQNMTHENIYFIFCSYKWQYFFLILAKCYFTTFLINFFFHQICN